MSPLMNRVTSRVMMAMLSLMATVSSVEAEGIGSRVFVVERETESLAIYDYQARRLWPKRISGLGDMRHATMIFSSDLRYGYLATRNGKVSRIDLEKLKIAGNVFTSQNSIDNAISQDARFLAVAEYIPGGLTILDAQSLKVLKRHEAFFDNAGKQLSSRVTGIVDAPGNRFVCTLIEGQEIWILDAKDPAFPILNKIKTRRSMPYDAMITPDGRFYLVGHMDSEFVSVLDLTQPEKGVREISLRDPKKTYERGAPMKLPHMASWAVAKDRVFVPLIGETRLAVLNRWTWAFENSVELRGHPVYAVRAPTETEIWVSFSGEKDDAFVQVIDAATLKVKRTIEVGERIYHMDFTPRGAYVLVSANKANKLVLVNANTYAIEDIQTVRSPSGIFGVWRAFQVGL